MLLNGLLFGGAGYWKMGQKRKALWASGVTITLGLITCGVGLLFSIVTAWDALKLAQRMKAGESIGDDECHFGFLVEVFR